MTGNTGRRLASADEAEALIGRTRTLCEQLLAITREQDALIERGETESLVRLVERREEIVTRIEQAGAGLRDLGLDQPGGLNGMDRAAQARVEAGLTAVTEIGAQIAEADRRAERAMLERKEAIGRELHGVRGGGRAVRAYGNGAGPASPRFEDRKG